MDLLNSIDFILVMRLFLSGFLGAVIGLERELRAKEAGLRTHFLVALGSCLFMIVSQFGFGGSGSVDGVLPGDASRVAAQIVTGIGFIGAGAIMVQRHYVHGLTTAAGLWVVAAIGMAVGGGLYLFAVCGTFFALIGLELFRALTRWMRLRGYEVCFFAKGTDSIDRMLTRVNEVGYRIANYKITSSDGQGNFSVSVILRCRSKGGGPNVVLKRLDSVEGVRIRSVE